VAPQYFVSFRGGSSIVPLRGLAGPMFAVRH